MGGPRKILLVALASVSVLGGGDAAGAYEARVSDDYFGVSAPDLWAATVQGKNAERNLQLDGIKAAGIDWVRTEIGWPEVEPNAPVAGTHTYDWSAADRQFRAFAERGLTIMPTVMATPSWASGSGSCGRRNGPAVERADDFGAFVEAAARRYGSNGSFWTANPGLPRLPVERVEIWNEPNWRGFWCPEPDPEAFARFMRAAATGLQRADPEIRIVVGGLAALQDSRHEGSGLQGLAADEFLSRMLAAEPTLRDDLDAVAFHPYDIDPAMNLSLIGWLRRHMESEGLGAAEIILTEFGWLGGGTLPDALSETKRAENYRELAGTLPRTDCGVTGIAAHSWATPELNLLEPDHWWGISSPITGLLYPSGEAYRDVIALFEGRGPEPAPRSTITVCGATTPPDQDADGTPDAEDDYPLDPSRSTGSGETPPPDPADDEPERPRVPPGFFGANVVQLPNDFTRLRAEFAAMSSVQIGTARQRIEWARIEPVAPDHPDYQVLSRWPWMDRVVLNMGLNGVNLMPSFGVPPSWAPVDDPDFNTRFAEFLRRYAARYGPGGSFWNENRNLDSERLAINRYEIWQEANVNATAPGGTASASRYADLYLSARQSLRAEVPGANAIVSVAQYGHAGDAGPFVRGMVAARPALAGSIDGVHVMATFARTSTEIEVLVNSVRQALDQTGNESAPIYLSFGAPTAGPGALSETQRASLYREVSSRLARSDCGLGGVFAHAWTTPESDAGNPWHWFGIADPSDASLSETAIAYRDVAASFLGLSQDQAPRETVHACGRPEPDQDGDGVPDPDDDFPLDVSRFDGTAPTVKVKRPRISGAKALLRFAASDVSAVTRFECRLNKNPWVECASPHRVKGLRAGKHRLAVRAHDEWENTGTSVTRWRLPRR